MESLPPRLRGFLESLAAISHGQYDQGGLDVTFPSAFDRNNLEVIWTSGLGTQRSGGFFKLVGIKEIAKFFDSALWDPGHPLADSRTELAEVFVKLVKEEFKTENIEFWCNHDIINATLSVCIEPGNNELWLELFWTVD